MIVTVLMRLTGLAIVLLLGALPLAAQEARDPTVAPAETGAAVISPAGLEGMTVLVRDEKPYLVIGTRLYAPGDKVGNLRVERITETEIWFHDGNALSKVPRFAGIARKTVVPKPVCAAAVPNPGMAPASAPVTGKVKKAKKRAPASSASLAPNPPAAAAPCEDTQP